MKPIAIHYEDLRSGERREVVPTPENLQLRLKAIVDENSARGIPFGVDLVSDNGDRLSVGLGRDSAVISHFDAKRVQAVTALGDADAKGNTTFYFGDHTLLPNKFLIPLDVAWQIIHQWHEHGTLSSEVTWTSAIR